MSAIRLPTTGDLSGLPDTHRFPPFGEGFSICRQSLGAWVTGTPVRLNDQTVLEADQSELADVKTKSAGVPAPKDKPRRGYVALQSHSGRVEFRKGLIRKR